MIVQQNRTTRLQSSPWECQLVWVRSCFVRTLKSADREPRLERSRYIFDHISPPAVLMRDGTWAKFQLISHCVIGVGRELSLEREHFSTVWISDLLPSKTGYGLSCWWALLFCFFSNRITYKRTKDCEEIHFKVCHFYPVTFSSATQICVLAYVLVCAHAEGWICLWCVLVVWC